jgi:biopolymer transport protein ExbD
VFVILLFFIVAAGTNRKENSLDSKLPSIDGEATLVDIPDEVVIRIASDGEIFLNEDSLEEPAAKPLRNLTESLRDLKQAVGGETSKIRILLSPDEAVKYQRIVDVLDVLAVEKISGVTFQAAIDE